MVNLPPEPENRPVTSRPRDNDEAIAIVIALLSIGTILGWVWSRDRVPFFAPLNATERSTESASRFNPFVGDREPESADRNTRFGERQGFAREPESDRTQTRRRDMEDRASLFPATRSSSQASIPSVAPIPIPEVAPAPQAPVAVPNVTTQEPLPPLDISDVPQDHWTYPFVLDLYEKGLLPDLPEGGLKPDQELTRAEFAALLHSSFVETDGQLQPQPFADVSSTYWANNAIQQVVSAGYMKGYPEDLFKPTELVPRYQVWVTLATGLGLPVMGDPDSALRRFQGAEEVPAWAKMQVATAANSGLVAQFPDPQRIAALEPATRGEIIVMIHQALLQQGRVDEIPSPYVAPPQSRDNQLQE